jgi:YHS domain-containing protein
MKKALLTLCLGLMLSPLAFAQKSEIFVTKGIAIRGYDPVAYFTDAKPVKGQEAYNTTYKGAKWQFASEEHLASFKAEPEKYVPQFGGYCAYGMSEGHKAPSQPEAFAVVDNRLYLNYNPEVNLMWSSKKEELITKANANWHIAK